MDFKQSLTDSNNLNCCITVQVAKPITDNSWCNLISKSEYDRMTKHLTSIQTRPPMKFTNRIYNYNGLRMLVGHRGHREYCERIDVGMVCKNNLSLRIYRENQIDRSEFPLTSEYNDVSVEYVTIFKVGPILIHMVELETGMYTIRLQTKLLENRGNYIIKQLEPLCRKLRSIIGDNTGSKKSIKS